MQFHQIKRFRQFCQWHEQKTKIIFERNPPFHVPILETQGFRPVCQLVFHFDALPVKFLYDKHPIKTSEVVKNHK